MVKQAKENILFAFLMIAVISAGVVIAIGVGNENPKEEVVAETVYTTQTSFVPSGLKRLDRPCGSRIRR